MKRYDFIETGINVMGISLSVTDLTQILNVILLAVSVASILFKAGYAVYTHIRNRSLDGAKKAIDEAKDELEKLREKQKNGRDHKGD